MVSYTISAQENYDAATVAGGWPGAGHANTTFYYTDQTLVSDGYDRVNRYVLYGCAAGALASQTNSTGHDLWTGQHKIASGANYDGQSYANHLVMQRPIDLPGTVVANQCFGAALTVPAGTTVNQSITGFSTTAGTGYTPGTYLMVPLSVSGTAQQVFMNCVVSGGGIPGSITLRTSYKATVGDVLTLPGSNPIGAGTGFQLTVTSVDSFVAAGTERRATEFDNTTQRNGNLFVNENTGDVWMHANAAGVGRPGLPCLVYVLRKSANFAQEISPMFPFDNTDRHMDVRGATSAYGYTLQYPNGAGGATYLVASPLLFQSTEVTLDYKLPYFWFANPVDVNPNNAGYFLISDCFSTNNKYYQFGAVASGTRNFALYRFDEPSAATVPYNQGVTGGGFTTITPWSSSTGPNAHVTGYTGTSSGGTRSRLLYLPATNVLTAVTSFYPQDKSGGTQSDFFMDCTYVGSPDGSATFDYHHAFVTGFVDVNFNPLSSSGNTAPASAAYAVIDVQDVNRNLNLTSYHYVDTNAASDYTVRWLAFTVLKCNPGDTVTPPTSVLTFNASYFTVFVAYTFMSGSAPVPTTVEVGPTVPETGWDTQLPLNPDYGGLTGNAVAEVIANSNASQAISGDYYSNGIWDAVTSAFWWSGQSTSMWSVSSTFGARQTTDNFNPSPPFLRLGFGGAPPVSSVRTQGHIY